MDGRKEDILRNSPEFLKKYFQKWTKKNLFAKKFTG